MTGRVSWSDVHIDWYGPAVVGRVVHLPTGVAVEVEDEVGEDRDHLLEMLDMKLAETHEFVNGKWGSK